MKITLAQNLRKLRRDQNLTQEELAGFLGISYQAISKWERDEGYPDITMLPVLANYFGITVDALIGNDITSREEQIRFYTDEYDRLNRNGKMDEAVELAIKAYHEYPYDWGIIDIYMRSLTRGYSEMPGEKMPELRSLCKMVVDKCPDAKIQMFAIYSMLFAEDDDHVEEWFARVPGTYDFTEGERREDRYLERGQMDKFRHQRQENMMQLFQYLHEKLRPVNSTPEETLLVYQHRIALLDALFIGENALLIRHLYAFDHLHLAASLFVLGRKDEGYAALSKAVDSLEEWIPIVGQKQYYSGIFDTMVPPARWNTSLSAFIRLLDGEHRHPGFSSVIEEEKYKTLVERIRIYIA